LSINLKLYSKGKSKIKNIRSMMIRKRTQKEKIKFELGCFMTVYNRPELLIDATTSILKCKDLTGIKFFIVNDGSTDSKIEDILKDFSLKLKSKGNEVFVFINNKNHGKEKYHKTIKECFTALSNCRYIMPLPPDFIYNPYIFQVARKCMEYIDDTVRTICFYKDSRNIRKENNIVNDYFIETQEVDWGPAIFDNKFVKEFLPKMKNMNSPAGTGTTHCIMQVARNQDYVLYKYKESLCEHIGNSDSVMNHEYRKQVPLKMADVNLDSIPEIMSGEIIDTGNIKSTHIEPSKPNRKRILVVKSGGLGNIICMTPIIIKLKKIYPKSDIDLLVENNAYRQVLINWKLLNNIYINGDQSTMPKYDIIINGSPEFIATHELKGDIYRGLPIWYKKYMHEVHANMRILTQCGWDEKDLPSIPEMYIPEPKTKRRLDEDFKGRKYIGISAGFYKEMAWKNWGYVNYARLIEKLLSKYKDHKVLIFGVGKDKKILDHVDILLIKGNNPRVFNCTDDFTIQETAYLIGKCKFMVANDTGLSHISSAVHTKCYTLFGMTPPRKALPYGYGVEVSLNLKCAENCYYEKRWADCKYKKCLKDMSVDFVLNRILEKEKFELGILMCTYNRYELLIATLTSFLQAFNDPSVKISIVDDGSSDKRINQALFQFKQVFKGEIVILRNSENKGRLGYPYTMYRAWNQLYDCKYILTMPDDALINPYAYEVFKKSYKYFGPDVKCINFFRDSRKERPYTEYDKFFFHTEPYDKYFEISTGVDGFACLFENKFLKTVNWNAPSTENKTNVWRNFFNQLKGYKNLLYKESLCSHIGNIFSIMWANKDGGRRTLSIEGLNVNLWDKPLILTNKAFKYGPEWYSEQYHSKGDYNLPKREYNELQDEWESLGYKKRLYQVLNDAERYIDFNDIKSLCEVGCHHGKSVFWMRERWPHIKYDAFDFSKAAIEWCQKNNPFDNIKFEIGDVRNMPYKKKFDIVSCLDVGEHLPEDVYFKMIDELKRISGKFILWYVGRTELEEHINLRSIDQQKEDLKELGEIIELPLYHLLIKVKQ
jgi:ADP-heptose:LPS heptosyltransferase